jgi:hypothetical protein
LHPRGLLRRNRRIVGWTEDPIAVCSDTLEGLSWHLIRMHACVSKPILREDGDTLLEEPFTEHRMAEKIMKRFDNAMRKLAKE